MAGDPKIMARQRRSLPVDRLICRERRNVKIHTRWQRKRRAWTPGAVTALELYQGIVLEGEHRLLSASDLGTDIPRWVSVPATATSSGVAGQLAYDSSYLYVCVNSNVWRRVAISSW